MTDCHGVQEWETCEDNEVLVDYCSHIWCSRPLGVPNSSYAYPDTCETLKV